MPLEVGFKHWTDTDTATITQSPPVQNTWYTVLDIAIPCRLIWCTWIQDNTDNAAKDCEIRWTIDGTVYFWSGSFADNTLNFVYRNYLPSAAGTTGLSSTNGVVNAAYTVDKRGAALKIEIRMTSVPGAAQVFQGFAVYERLV